jgi:hypothetical protein
VQTPVVLVVLVPFVVLEEFPANEQYSPTLQSKFDKQLLLFDAPEQTPEVQLLGAMQPFWASHFSPAYLLLTTVWVKTQLLD